MTSSGFSADCGPVWGFSMTCGGTHHGSGMIPIMSDGKATEQRLRRAAKRAGLLLRKSRTRNPDGSDYGAYYIIDPDVNGLLATCYDLTQVEAELSDISRRSAR